MYIVYESGIPADSQKDGENERKCFEKGWVNDITTILDLTIDVYNNLNPSFSCLC